MEHVSQSATAESAMTEIALALAMGFFAIMVLTMVSMGAGQPESAEKAKIRCRGGPDGKCSHSSE